MVVVPLYACYGEEAVAFIVNQCQITTIYVDTVTRLEAILGQLKDFPTLKKVIIGEDKFSILSVGKFRMLKDRAEEADIQLFTIAEVEYLGEQNPVFEDHLPRTEDLALVCYTSGSTGMPKGVLMSHRNVVADCSAIHYHFGDFKFTEIDRIIGFLPLGHMYERVCEYLILHKGGSVGYASGDPQAFLADLQLVQPTFMPAVPRMLNRVYARIKETVAAGGWLKRALFAVALSTKRAQFRNGMV